MNKSIIGDNIAELRKAKGATQEALADAVGLTAQAVSKWESGGLPDASLLPLIADYFGVSIDRLFGRSHCDYANIQANVSGYIASLPANEKMQKAYEICFGMLHTLIEMPGDASIDISHPFLAAYESRRDHAEIISDTGMVKAGLDRKLRYFLLMPEPEEGWGHRLEYNEAYSRLFAILGDEDVLKTLFYLESGINESFTPKLLEKGLGLDKDKAAKILNTLAEYRLVIAKELKLDGETIVIYEDNPNISFVPLLIFAEEIIKRPDLFYLMWGNRANPLLTQK